MLGVQQLHNLCSRWKWRALSHYCESDSSLFHSESNAGSQWVFSISHFFYPAIATSEVQDVREVMDFYNRFDDPIEAFRENQRKLQVHRFGHYIDMETRSK